MASPSPSGSTVRGLLDAPTGLDTVADEDWLTLAPRNQIGSGLTSSSVASA
jgi:hypothetical protein